MFNDSGATVVRKPYSFLAVAAFGLSGVLITAIVCASAIGLYGLRVVDRKADGLIGLVGDAAGKLPELRAALPPALFDAIDDVRSPEYVQSLKVTSSLAPTQDRWGRRRVAIEVENHGEQVVSLLSMRVLGLDEDGDAVDERNVWAATPIQLEDDWRGPILPGETRRLLAWCDDHSKIAGVAHEITEVRVWDGDSEVEHVKQLD